MLNNFSALIKKTIFLLNQKKNIAFKTDTVPGVAGLAGKETEKKLLALKNRPLTKPFVLMYASLQDVEKKYFISQENKKKLEKYWPGAFTFILQEKTSQKKVGVRIPNDAFILQLLRELKEPLIVTSANLSGEKEILSIEEIKKKFGNQIALYIDQRKKSFDAPSAVVDLTTNPSVILRKGVADYQD